MSFSDWTETIAAGNSSALFNIELSNGLDITDGYIHHYNRCIDMGGANTNKNLYKLVPAAYNGSDVNSGFSLRAWLRSNGGSNASGFSSYGGISLFARAETGTDTTGYQLTVGDGDGYSTGFQTDGDGYTDGYVFGLTLSMTNGANRKVVYLRDEKETGVVDSTKVSRDTWYRVRMDVYQVDSGLDVIDVYIATEPFDTGIDESWTLLHSEQLELGVDSHKKGFDVAHTYGFVSYETHSAAGSDQAIQTYIDAFEIRKKAL